MNTKKIVVIVSTLIFFSLVVAPKSDAAYLNITGFETGDTLETAGTTGTVSIQNTQKRTGSYGLQVTMASSTNNVFIRGMAANGTSVNIGRTAETYYTFHFKITSDAGGTTQFLASIEDATGNNVMDLLYGGGGQINIYSSGSGYGGQVTGVNNSQWHRIDLRVTSNGVVGMRLDGGNEVTGTANNYTQDRLVLGSAGTLSGAGATVAFDDVAISNSANPGSGEVKILVPNANGPFREWTCNTSSDEGCVNTIPHDADSFYLSTSTMSRKTNVNLTNATGLINGAIGTVKVVGIVRDEGGVSGLQICVDDTGGGGAATTSVDPGSTYTAIAKIMDTNPNGGAAWTLSNLDSELACVTSNNSVAMRTTGLYLMVWSDGASAPTVASPTTASLTPISVTLGGNVTSGGTASITARGVCYSPSGTDSDPRLGDPGVTCAPEGATTTGVFTKAVSSLTPNTLYAFNAYATNSVGTGYVLGSFTTPSDAPATVSTADYTPISSYRVTLNGSANPNGYETKGHFRVFPTDPGNCNSDSGGFRFPESNVNDVSIGSSTQVQNFSYTIPLNSSSFLVPNTTYWYCSYVLGGTAGNTLSGASGIKTFIMPDGPASPCDPPTSGNLTIPAGAACTFSGNFDGVDAGSGNNNTGALTISAGTSITIGASQQIGFGSLIPERGASIVLQRGATLIGGGVFVHDKDRDGILDSKTQYVGSTASAATEFVRRNTIATTYNYAWKLASASASIDCNTNNANVYRNIGALVTDADNDGYKTAAAAAPQCVGLQTTINGRTYFKDSSNNNTFMPDAQKLSTTTDCYDTSAAPCPPSQPSVSTVSQAALNVNWSATTGPAPSSYNIEICTGASCNSGWVSQNGVTPVWQQAGLTCNTTKGYRVTAVNADGNSTVSAIGYGTTSSCASPPSVTTSAASSVTGLTAILNSTVNPNGASTSITYRYQAGNTATCNSGTPTSTIAGPSGLTGSNPLSGASTQQSLTGLIPNTQYSFCAVGANSQGTVYGSPALQFTTPRVFYDTFTDTNGVLLENHTPNAGTGWTKLIDVGTGNLVIASNTLYTSAALASAGELYQTNDTIPSADYRVYATMTVGDNADDTNILAGRIQDANNMYAVRFNTAVTELYKRVGSVWTLLGTGTPMADGSVVSLNMSGTNIAVLDDGVENIGVSDSSISGAGKAGIGIGGVIVATDDYSSQQLDNFEVGNAIACTNGYIDADVDGYGTGSSGCHVGAVGNNTDCYDGNANARPGQTSYFSTNRGDGSYDYNCDSSQTLLYPSNTCAQYGSSFAGGAFRYTNYTGVCTQVFVNNTSGSCGNGAATCGGFYMAPNFEGDSSCSGQVGYLDMQTQMPCR